MIIGSWDALPLGKREVGRWHLADGVVQVQPYVPVRVATHEEWAAEQRGRGYFIPDDHERATFYYEVSTD